MDPSPNYSEYSVSELKEALETIDKTRFPDRTAIIENELKTRISSLTKSETVLTERNDKSINAFTSGDAKVAHFIIRLWCVGLFYFPVSKFYAAYQNLPIYKRKIGEITFDSHPVAYSLEIGISFLFAVLLILAFAFNPFKYKKSRKVNGLN